MNKIYVRNTFGYIYKIDDLTEIMYKTDFLYNRIVKQSNNIIDLVQSGDIVKYKLKGLKRISIAKVINYIDARSDKELLLIEGYSLENVEILEILTKEKYNQECFKVVE